MNKSNGTSGKTLRLGVLLSGGGSTMVNLQEYIQRGELSAQIVQVISSRPSAAGVQRAEERDLPIQVIARKQFDSTGAFSAEIWSLLRSADVELVCLAGFLSMIDIPDDYMGRVMNTHPALLPSFGGHGMWGHHVHEAVLAAGCKVSGCTIHFADDEYDNGPIIIQRSCAVHEDDTPDTLAERVIAEERIAFPQAVQLYAEGRLKIEGQCVRVTQPG